MTLPFLGMIKTTTLISKVYNLKLYCKLAELHLNTFRSK